MRIDAGCSGAKDKTAGDDGLVGIVVVAVVVLRVMAPVFRYLLGGTLYATVARLVAVGILHVAFKARSLRAPISGVQPPGRRNDRLHAA